MAEKGKISLPYNLAALCLGDNGIFCEKRRGEIVFKVSEGETCFLNDAEICDWVLMGVPGGLELRLEAAGMLISKKENKLSYVSSISFDEEKRKDNSSKPSLVLLKPSADGDVWSIAKENCSSREAIFSANGIEDISEALGRLILIPKTD